ncbi:MAG: lipopolysaccharide biosynthesis protein [Pseudonocardiaceae bacterium]
MTATQSSPPTWSPATMMASARRVIGDPASVLLTCQLIVAAVAFVANILAARTLEPAGRGELALLLQIAYMSSLGLVLGTDRSVVVVYTGTPVRIVTRSFVRLLLTPSAICLAVAVAAAAIEVPGIGSWRIGLALALLFAVTNAFARAVRSIAIAAGRQQDYLRYTLLSNGLLILAIVALFVLEIGNSALWVLAYLVAGTVSAAACLARWAYSGRPASRGGVIPEDGPRQARREGLQLFPYALAHSGVLRLDRLLLAGLASTAALGIYASVATMTELIAWPLLAFVSSRLGAWRKAHDSGTLSLRKLFVLAAAYCITAAVLMAVATHFLLLPLLGPAYRSASELVFPLVAAAGVFGMGHLVTSMLIAIRRNSLASVAEVVGFGVSVVSYVVLIGQYGALGAAYGSLVGYFTSLAVAGGILLICLRRPRRPLHDSAGPTGENA